MPRPAALSHTLRARHPPHVPGAQRPRLGGRQCPPGERSMSEPVAGLYTSVPALSTGPVNNATSSAAEECCGTVRPTPPVGAGIITVHHPPLRTVPTNTPPVRQRTAGGHASSDAGSPRTSPPGLPPQADPAPRQAESPQWIINAGGSAELQRSQHRQRHTVGPLPRSEPNRSENLCRTECCGIARREKLEEARRVMRV